MIKKLLQFKKWLLLLLIPVAYAATTAVIDYPVGDSATSTPEFISKPELDKKTKDSLDRSIKKYSTLIDLFQDWHLLQTDRYWQSTDLYSVLPTGVELPDKKTAKISSEAYTWEDVADSLKLEKLPFNIRISNYDGPRGYGYIVYFEYLKDDFVYNKAVVIGNETERAYDWK